MTLNAQAAVLAEQTAELSAIRSLLADILAAEEALISNMTGMGYAPRPELFPFHDRIRALVRPLAKHAGVREFVPALNETVDIKGMQNGKA